MIQSLLRLLLLSVLATGCSQKYYIVRHAEKAQASDGITMQTKNDPPLSDAGKRRAEELKLKLAGAGIGQVFSTNTLRTVQTATPFAESRGLTIQHYGKTDSTFFAQLKSLKKNTLIVGHSNTVDDLVNGLIGKVHFTDLPDAAYDNLFIVRKKGKRLTFFREKFGQPSAE